MNAACILDKGSFPGNRHGEKKGAKAGVIKSFAGKKSPLVVVWLEMLVKKKGVAFFAGLSACP